MTEQIHCTPSLSPCQRSCGPSTQGILETQLSSRYTYADATRTPLIPGSLSTPPLSLQATKRRRTCSEAQPASQADDSGRSTSARQLLL